MRIHSSHKVVFLVVICLTLVGTSNGQDTQRVDVSGGYSLLRDSSVLEARNVFNGWDSAATLLFNRWFGVTADVSGFYGAETLVIAPSLGTTAGKIRLSSNPYYFMLGPHFTYRRARYALFTQALFGGYHNQLTETTLVPVMLVPVTCSPPQVCSGPTHEGGVQRGFAMALGGGLDIKLGHGISFRPVQAEYLLRRVVFVFANNGSFPSSVYYPNTFRYSTGIVFHFERHLSPEQ